MTTQPTHTKSVSTLDPGDAVLAYVGNNWQQVQSVRRNGDSVTVRCTSGLTLRYHDSDSVVVR